MAYQSPNKVYGVQYYNQFLKHFLKPYGEIKECIEEEQIIKDIKPINCEYLGRPKIALGGRKEKSSKISMKGPVIPKVQHLHLMMMTILQQLLLQSLEEEVPES